MNVQLSIKKSQQEILKDKLKEKVLEKSSKDPKWITFRNLKARGVPNLPTPLEVVNNKLDILSQMDNLRKVLPADNPFIQYIEMCLQ
jgi:hypothetical protein